MMSLSTFQQSNGSFNKINKEDDAKQKLGECYWKLFIARDRIPEFLLPISRFYSFIFVQSRV